MEEGNLEQAWKDNNIVDFNPTHWKYVGDATMRPATYQNQVARDKINDYAREKIGRPLAEEVQLSNFAKKLKEPSISEVPIHICLEISYS